MRDWPLGTNNKTMDIKESLPCLALQCMVHQEKPLCELQCQTHKPPIIQLRLLRLHLCNAWVYELLGQAMHPFANHPEAVIHVKMIIIIPSNSANKRSFRGGY